MKVLHTRTHTAPRQKPGGNIGRRWQFRWRNAGFLLLLAMLAGLLCGCNSPRSYDLTPEDHRELASAIKQDIPATIQQYLEKGMSPNAQDEKGVPYIFVALRQGQSDIVRGLLNGRADPNQKTAGGNTLLHVAVAEQRPDIVNVLLRWGAEVNVKNDQSDTPLHLAAKGGNPDIARALLEKKAEMGVKNLAGKTARELATENNNTDVLALFEKNAR